MKKNKNSKKTGLHNTKRFGGLGLICWIVIPLAVIILLVLDGAGVYSLTAERLIVLGAGLLVILLPFFSEITVKNISLKKDKGTAE